MTPTQAVNKLVGQGILKEYPPENAINSLIRCDGIDTSKISDGFHTFGELYDCRMILTAICFNSIMPIRDWNLHKSKKHHDGELCFGGRWFIVCGSFRGNQFSFHYPVEYWDLFALPVRETASLPFDGHTTRDVLQILAIINEHLAAEFPYGHNIKKATNMFIKKYAQE